VVPAASMPAAAPPVAAVQPVARAAAAPPPAPAATPPVAKNVHLPLERRQSAAAKPTEQVADLEEWSELPDIA
jgi:hypothetical protein